MIRRLLLGLTALCAMVAIVSPLTAFAQAAATQSRNWAGYIATDASYTQVSALIQAPTAASARSFGSEASWVGIGGASSGDSTLIQAGVNVTQRLNGTAQYYAWYEMLPAASVQISTIPVEPGSWILFSIQETSPNVWQISVVNGTTVFQQQFNYVSSHASAEWIAEAPSVASGRIIHLDPTTNVNFASMMVTANGQFLSPSQLPVQTTELVNVLGMVKAEPTTLSASANGVGAGFGVVVQ